MKKYGKGGSKKGAPVSGGMKGSKKESCAGAMK